MSGYRGTVQIQHIQKKRKDQPTEFKISLVTGYSLRFTTYFTGLFYFGIPWLASWRWEFWKSKLNPLKWSDHKSELKPPLKTCLQWRSDNHSSTWSSDRIPSSSRSETVCSGASARVVSTFMKLPSPLLLNKYKKTFWIYSGILHVMTEDTVKTQRTLKPKLTVLPNPSVSPSCPG